MFFRHDGMLLEGSIDPFLLRPETWFGAMRQNQACPERLIDWLFSGILIWACPFVGDPPQEKEEQAVFIGFPQSQPKKGHPPKKLAPIFVDVLRSRVICFEQRKRRPRALNKNPRLSPSGSLRKMRRASSSGRWGSNLALAIDPKGTLRGRHWQCLGSPQQLPFVSWGPL